MSFEAYMEDRANYGYCVECGEPDCETNHEEEQLEEADAIVAQGGQA